MEGGALCGGHWSVNRHSLVSQSCWYVTNYRLPTDVFILLIVLPTHNNLPFGLPEQFHQTSPVSGRHDAGEVGTLLRLIGVELLQDFDQRRDQGVPSRGGAQHVVWSHAALTSIKKLGPGQAVSSSFNVHTPIYEARTFSPQLQSYWCQVDQGCLCNATGHSLRTWKTKMKSLEVKQII